MKELGSVLRADSHRPAAARRVCLIIGQLGLGGAEKQLVLLADGLKRHGVEVTVVVLTRPGPREDELHAAGVPVTYLNLRQNHGLLRSMPHLLASVGRLAAHLRRVRPDVVHAFLLHSYLMAAPAARLARVPVVIAGRRSLDDYKRDHRLVLLAERIATAITDVLVANAHAVAHCVRIGERVRPDKLVVIYNGLPPAAFATAEPAALAADHPVVLCVANLRPAKGHAHLLDAAALLAERGLPCTVVLVGEGSERQAIDQQAERLGIDVRLLGPRTDIHRLLARADVVALPSLTEGMSNAVMEAMAAGRPVVATAVGGSPELLADDRGLLVASADPAGLADALALLLTDPELARRMSRAARTWSLAHLQSDLMVRRHLALYDELLVRSCAA